jgi:hypothetical protein
MTANERQVDGAHYKGKPIQHWDFVLMHKMPYMEAQIFKYVLRWKDKNGLHDLRKAQHFIEKLIEWELAAQKPVVDVCSGAQEPTGDVLAQQEAEDAHLEECRKALSSKDAMNRYMNPDAKEFDTGEPQGKGYVDQD